MAKPGWRDVRAVRRGRLVDVLEGDGRTQTTFAEEVLGSKDRRGDLCRWLSPNGKRVPSTDDYLKIAEATGYSVDWLLGRSEATDRASPLSLTAARQIVLEAIVKQLLVDRDVKARHRALAPIPQDVLCRAVATEAVVRAFRTPALLQWAKAAYLGAFDKALRNEEQVELHRLRQEVRRLRRRPLSRGTTTGTTNSR